MPAKNSVKTYAPDSYYHIYNRGVEKRNIFVDSQDFAVFLSYLKIYLEPKDDTKLRTILGSNETSYKEKNNAAKALRLNNFHTEIEVVAYVLMPNHFHFLIRQTSEDAIDRFVNSLGTRYSMYFNKKYRRVGKLYAGVYKAVLVRSDEQLLHLSRYIHLNPINYLGILVRNWQQVNLPFSLAEYLGIRKSPWINPKPILDYFKKSDPAGDYLNFLAHYADPEIIAPIALDFED